jgi:transposase
VSVTIHPSSSTDAEIIAQLRKELGTTQNQLQWAELKIEALEARLRKLRIDKYGPGSEKLSDAQLELLELEPGVSGAEVQAESQRPKIAATTKPRQKHPGRQPLPPGLPRVEKIVSCTPGQCVCPGCGEQRVIIGHEESEQLDVEPAKYFVRVTRREKRACGRCEAGGVVTAPLPPRIIEKGLASDAIVIDTLVNKYCDHVPLYRQSAILKREAGVDVSRATLDDWVLHVGEFLLPLVGAMRQELLRESYIQADETPVAVQMHDGRGKNHQAYLWQYGCPGGDVIFDFRLGRERDGPKKFLGSFNGILQSDGYAAYDQIGGPNLVHVGCWSHTERYFAEAVELNPQDPWATSILSRIVDLFAIDAEARQQNLTLEGRLALRQEKSRPLLRIIRQQVEAARPQVLPASALAKACNYTLAQWDRLARCLDYAQVELSNNWAENSMRPVAVGRKNWIHIGSPQAGPKIAAILSVAESCRRRKIPARSYLGAVLPGLANVPIQRLPELTPAAWNKQHS